jgi:rfaE bifunctional protein kinase chain/domain
MTSEERLMKEAEQILERFNRVSVLVIGDLMLDEYIIGDAERISPEAPVPVLLRRERRIGPGGAANVVYNLISMGARTIVGGVIGKDSAGEELKSLLREIGADTSAVIVDESRPTTLKTRIIAHKQQLVRIDHEVRKTIDDKTCDALIERVASMLAQVDAVIISDYAKGVVTSRLTDSLRSAQERYGFLLCGGPKPKNIASFVGFDLLSFNMSEARESAMLNGELSDDYKLIGKTLASRLQIRWLVITRGEEGASLFDTRGWLCDIPSYRVTVYDVAGAGDTFLAAIVLALCCGADFVTAAKIACAAGAVAVCKSGVAPATVDEIKRIMSYGSIAVKGEV